jgi:hypothetical protein
MTTTIKSEFQAIVSFLQANQGKKVASILPEIIEMATKKRAETNFYKDASGKTIAMKCYYFKVWFKLSEVEWSPKANTASGYNQMCKAGLSAWTRQQREAEKARANLLSEVTKGTLLPQDIPAREVEIEAARTKINMDLVPTENYFQTLEELLDTM